MRLFYASFLSPENMSAYESLVGRLRAEVHRALRPVPTRTHHLTLAFLGETDDKDVDRCLSILESARSLPAAPISLGPPRILYGRGQPRLICADLVAGGDDVAALQEQLRVELSQHLPSLEVRPKPPHVTLARFNRKAQRKVARRVEESLSREDDRQPHRTDSLASVHLVKSSLTADGPIYESLREVILPPAVPPG